MRLSGAAVGAARHQEDGIRDERRLIAGGSNAHCPLRSDDAWPGPHAPQVAPAAGASPRARPRGFLTGLAAATPPRHRQATIEWTRRARERTALRSSAPAVPG